MLIMIPHFGLISGTGVQTKEARPLQTFSSRIAHDDVSKWVFIATQLNSTQLDVELS